MRLKQIAILSISWFISLIIVQIIIFQIARLPVGSYYATGVLVDHMKRLVDPFLLSNFRIAGSILYISIYSVVITVLLLFTFKFKWFRLLAIWITPTFGILLHLLIFVATTQPCYSFDCAFPSLASVLSSYYWLLCCFVFPFAWIFGKYQENPKHEIIQFAKAGGIIIGVYAISFILATSILSVTYNSREAEHNATRSKYITQMKSELTYVLPTYHSPGIGEIEFVEFADLIEDVNIRAIRTFYYCKDRHNTDDYFEIRQTPIMKQKIQRFEELEIYMRNKGAGMPSMSTREIVDINGTKGIFRLWQMQGASHSFAGDLYFLNSDSRIEMRIFDVCVKNKDEIRTELIKIAKSLQPAE